jgi:hypothetical protein
MNFRLAKKVKKGKRPKSIKSSEGSLFRLFFFKLLRLRSEMGLLKTSIIHSVPGKPSVLPVELLNHNASIIVNYSTTKRQTTKILLK